MKKNRHSKHELLMERVYDFLRERRVESVNISPVTVREIMDAMDMKSTSHVKYILDELESEGRIRREKDKSRMIEVLDDQPPAADR